MSRSELAIVKKAANFIKANMPLAEYEEMDELEQLKVLADVLTVPPGAPPITMVAVNRVKSRMR